MNIIKNTKPTFHIHNLKLSNIFDRNNMHVLGSGDWWRSLFTWLQHSLSMFQIGLSLTIVNTEDSKNILYTITSPPPLSQKHTNKTHAFALFNWLLIYSFYYVFRMLLLGGMWNERTLGSCM